MGVSGSFEYWVKETVAQCKPAWVKDRVEIISSGSDEDEGTDDEENWATSEEKEFFEEKWEIQMQVERTFICYVAVPCQGSALTVSSTDAHCPDIKNPRFCVNILHED